MTDPTTTRRRCWPAYVEPGQRDTVETIDKLIAILDAEKLVKAMQDQKR